MTEFEYKTIVIDSKETEHSEKSLSDKLNHYGKGRLGAGYLFRLSVYRQLPIFSYRNRTESNSDIQKAAMPQKGGGRMTNAVEVRHLSKSIEGSPILNDICMNVRQGEVYGFLGANGAGKTSLMKTLYHIIFPDTGTVCLLGETINKGNNPVFSRIGSIIESPVFYSHLSAYENMELHCRYMGAGYENIMETLSLLGIAETGKKAVGKFSLGMKQRLALARAMLTKPDLLILDEPINGLDPQGIIEVRELLLRINHEYHTSILISSHILDELSKIADTIGIIDHGAMLAEVSMKELTAKGIDLETYYLGLLGGGEKNVEPYPHGN